MDIVLNWNRNKIELNLNDWGWLLQVNKRTGALGAPPVHVPGEGTETLHRPPVESHSVSSWWKSFCSRIEKKNVTHTTHQWEIKQFTKDATDGNQYAVRCPPTPRPVSIETNQIKFQWNSFSWLRTGCERNIWSGCGNGVGGGGGLREGGYHNYFDVFHCFFV